MKWSPGNFAYAKAAYERIALEDGRFQLRKRIAGDNTYGTEYVLDAPVDIKGGMRIFRITDGEVSEAVDVTVRQYYTFVTSADPLDLDVKGVIVDLYAGKNYEIISRLTPINSVANQIRTAIVVAEAQ